MIAAQSFQDNAPDQPQVIAVELQEPTRRDGGGQILELLGEGVEGWHGARPE